MLPSKCCGLVGYKDIQCKMKLISYQILEGLKVYPSRSYILFAPDFNINKLLSIVFKTDEFHASISKNMTQVYGELMEL